MQTGSAYGVDSRTEFEIVLSTSADQIAVAPGVLQKEWQQEGRRYFHYKAEEPILPNLSFCSARYAVARDRWKDVALEIYYDPKHPFNIAAMMETAKRGLEMFSTEFAPYQYSYLRILEYPRYRSGGKVPFRYRALLRSHRLCQRPARSGKTLTTASCMNSRTCGGANASPARRCRDGGCSLKTWRITPR